MLRLRPHAFLDILLLFLGLAVIPVELFGETPQVLPVDPDQPGQQGSDGHDPGYDPPGAHFVQISETSLNGTGAFPAAHGKPSGNRGDGMPCDRSENTYHSYVYLLMKINHQVPEGHSTRSGSRLSCIRFTKRTDPMDPIYPDGCEPLPATCPLLRIGSLRSATLNPQS